jgi:hypothetical protein
MITHGNELIASREHLPLAAHARNSKDLPAILRSRCHQQNQHTENLHLKPGLKAVSCPGGDLAASSMSVADARNGRPAS